MNFIKQRGAGRRRVLQAGLGLAGAGLLGGRAGAATSIKIGYVSPQTGPLAAFGKADSFVIGAVTGVFKSRGLYIEILVRDSQSSSNRAATVANDLINQNISLMLVAATPETTNPVSDQCELAQVPCISTVAPWQPWYFTRGGTPTQGFTYTYHFFWGLEDVIASFTSMWSQLSTNKIVGALFPNDGDGNAWGDPKRGFPPALGKLGYQLHDPGRFQDGSSDFSAQIDAYKSANVQTQQTRRHRQGHATPDRRDQCAGAGHRFFDRPAVGRHDRRHGRTAGAGGDRSQRQGPIGTRQCRAETRDRDLGRARRRPGFGK